MTTNNLIYLGNLPDLDPNEGGVGDTASENAGFLSGKTFSTGIKMATVDLAEGGDWYVADKGEAIGFGGSEPVTYNLGSGSVTTNLDGTVFVNVTLQLAGGDTASALATVIQMENGDAFLANYFTLTSLNGLDVAKVTVDSIFLNAYPGYYVGSGIAGGSVHAGDGIVDGTAGADSMGPGYEDAQGDQVDGTDGVNDSIRGNSGNDTINAGDGNDTVEGGADFDSLQGGAGDDVVYGGTEADTLAGGNGNDTLVGGSGDDDIAVGDADRAFGGSGDDVFTLDGTDGAADINTVIDGGADATSGLGDDAANGNAGDILDLSARSANIIVTLGSNPETGTVNGLDGDAGSDISYAEIEKILTGSGNDTINGSAATAGINVDAGAGHDNVAGGSGNDTIAGGSGNDRLTGGVGADSLVGGAGTDTLVGGEGADVLDGGLGDDDLVVGAGDQALGGSGDDVFTIDDTLTGSGAVTVTGGETAEDLTDPANGGLGDVLDLRGQTGVVVTYNTADPTYNPATGVSESGTATYLNGLGQSVTVNFNQIETVLRDPAGTIDGLVTGEVMGPGYTDLQGDQIDGGDGLNDTILGNGGDDVMDAGAGNDTVDGGADNDRVTGGAGNDSVLGGAGSDTLAGGSGTDVLDGGAGDDDIAVGGADTATGGAGDDVFTLDDTDPAGDVNATLDGGTDATSASPEGSENGNAGDVLDLTALSVGVTVALGTNPETGTVNGLDADGATDIAFAEIERILTGSGSDTIEGAGATGPVTIDAGAGNDSIATGSGNDNILAGPGDDTVSAGGGNDTVTGGDGNDSLVGGDGNDTLDGGNDRDTLQGDAGNDSLTGVAGNDSLVGGAGADTLDGGDDADTLDGGTGNDSLVGGGGADLITSGPAGAPDIGYPGLFAPDATPNDDLDTVYGGAGADTIATGDDRDLVYGGTEGDSIDGGVDADTLYGDEGADTILGGEGADLVYGGAEGDVLYGGLSNPALDGLNIDDATDLAPNNGRDTLYGGDGADLIKGQDDADSLFGDAGADTLEGGIDNDSLFGGAEGDSLDGDDGRDLLNGGAGADALTGGAGADVFVADGTADTITDFDVTTGAGDADPLNNDNVDLQAYYNAATLAAWNAANPGQTYNDPLDWLRADQADGVLQGAGGLRIQNGGVAVAGAGLTTENTSVICFARGTLISTINGTVAIEDLTAGDLVLTVDNGYKPIRWIGSRKVDGRGKFAPIRFEAGVLDNDRPLTVSPQHRVQVRSTIAAKMFNSHDVLVAAKHLLGLPGVIQVAMEEVEYFHFLLDQHELVLSEGAVTETLFTGPEALKAVEPAARAEILAIFPDLADLDPASLAEPVRPLVTGRMGRQLAARHLRNNKRLVA